MGTMRKSDQGNNVLWGGYPTPPLMEDLVNLVLIYDKIYDNDGSLEILKIQSKMLAQHFSGIKLRDEDIIDWYFNDAFLMVFSIAAYHGVDIRETRDINLLKIINWIAEAKNTRKADRIRFIKILDNYFQFVYRKDQKVANEVVKTLYELHRLFDEGIIIPREILLPNKLRMVKTTSDILKQAIENDMEDAKFISLASEIPTDVPPQFTSLIINSTILDSSYLGIPLHQWSAFQPLIEYKYLRGARYFPELAGKKVVQEAFTVFIPEVYTLDISDLMEVRNSSEFSNFRREIDIAYREALETPHYISGNKKIGEYLKTKYWSQIERLAIQRRPKPGAELGTILVKNLISIAHPLLGLVPSVKEVYEEYEDKYRRWRFAVPILDMKAKLRTYDSR